MINTKVVVDVVTLGTTIFGAVSALVRAIPTKHPDEEKHGFLRFLSRVFQASRYKKGE